MERFLFDNLPKTYREDTILESLHFPQDADAEDLEEARRYIHEAETIANPKVLFSIVPVQERQNDFVIIGGVRIDCALMAENFRHVHRVFPYVCTCGQEVEAWSATLKDPLLTYWADRIKLFYVGVAQSYLFRYVREHYVPSGYLSRMNPGSLSQWPLSQQEVLFSLIGGVKESIGVTLTDSFLMLPSKSTSGILFSSDTAYENCQLCPMQDCPGRRAPYQNNT